MLNKDLKTFLGGLNKDDSPQILPEGDYTEGLNIRTGSSKDDNEAGPAETLQSEIEDLINVDADITYYGEAIGGKFLYQGWDTVQIGTQVWMKKNWDVAYPGSKVYNDDEVNRGIYGGLYTWDQIMSADFCPDGWHVPTEAEIDALLTYVGGAMIAGTHLKEVGNSHWTYFDAGLSIRQGQIGGVFVMQAALTPLGFDGIEGVDYETIDSHSGVLTGTYRETVIGGNYVLEVGTDFSGVEGVDYEILINE